MEKNAHIKKIFLATLFILGSNLLAETHSKAKSEPPPDTHFNEIEFVAFDTETTGFSPENDRIVEIGAVKFKAGQIVSKREWLINPGVHIPGYATKVHGITDETVADKPTFEEVYPEFLEYVEGTVLIAHNSRFDRDFMRAEMERGGLESPGIILLDSLKILRDLLPNAESHSISNLVDYLDIEASNFHRATVDSQYIGRILKKVVNRRNSPLSFQDLIDLNNGKDHL